MLQMSGAEVVELGAVNQCSADTVQRACRAADVAAAYYVLSAETFPYGTVALEPFVRIAQANGVKVVVDASAQPLMRPIATTGPDLIIASPHKMMGSPTAGLILGREEFVAQCRLLEGSFARPFKTSKETLAGVAAAVTRWAADGERIVNELWEERARYAERQLSGIVGIRFECFYYPFPLQGVQARVVVDPTLYGMDAARLADRLRTAHPRIAVIEEEIQQGALLLHFAMLAERQVDVLAQAVRSIQRREPPSD
jgi:L-seryl-tRNA(Ser) seleniumtransferase